MNLRKLVLSLIGISILVTCNSYAPIVITDYQMKAYWPANPEAFVVFKSYPYSFTTGEGTFASTRVYTVPAGFIDTTVADAAISGKGGSVYFVKTGTCKLYIEGTTNEGAKVADSLVGISVQNPFRISGKSTITIQAHDTLSLTPIPAGMAPQAQVIWKINNAVVASQDPAALYDFSAPVVGSYTVSATIADAGQKNTLQLDATDITVQLNPVQTYAVTVSAVNGVVTKYPEKTVYDAGSVIGLKAAANTGYHFVNWSGDATGASDSIGVTVNGPLAIVANFEVNAVGKVPLSITSVNGTVTKTPDNTQYDVGSTVKLKAVPAAGYHFVNWTGDATGSIDSVTVIMTGAKSVVANFAANPIPTYLLVVTASNGTVTKTPDKAQYDSGSVVGLKAKAAAGYHFVNWAGDVTGSSDSLAVPMNGAKNIVANFEKNAVGKFPISITATNGTVTKTPDQTQYDSGSTVKLKAVPAAGYHFVNWSGDAAGTVDSVVILMNAAKSVVAVFAANPIPQYALSVTATNGSVTKTPDNAFYDSNSTVKLKAVAAVGYHFVNWTGDATGTTDTVSVKMNGVKSVVTNFAANPIPKYTLATTATNGTITKTPDLPQYDSSSKVGLKARPAAGYHFVNWSGDATGTSDSINLTMNGNKSVTANFEANAVGKFTISITAANGSVTKTPDQTQYDSGTTVKLKAKPSMGYHFVNWSGDATGTADSVSIVVNGNKSVIAGFAIYTYALTVTATNGSVTKTPSQTSYDSGSTVTLNAQPAAGYQFTNWSGDITGTNPSASIVMTGVKNVIANFSKKQFTLALSAQNGSIVKNPDLASYDSGATVNLTAQPAAGYQFSSWGGDLSGTNPSASIVMTGSKSITANFTKKQFTIALSAQNGSIVKNPDQASYDSGATVLLTAQPSAGYQFSSWSGDVSGTNPSVSITMTANKSAIATFTKKQFTLTLSAQNGSIAKNPDLASYDSGTTILLTASPAAGYQFANWTGDLSGTNPSASITMTANKSVIANFTKKQFTLTLSAQNGSVAKNPDKTTYDSGASVQLTPTGSTGYHFSSWSGDLNGSANPATIIMNASKSVTANFAPDTFTVTFTTDGNGTIQGTNPQKIPYNGTTASVTAVPNSGYMFNGWTGGYTGTANPFLIANVTSNLTIQANFKTPCEWTEIANYSYSHGYLTGLGASGTSVVTGTNKAGCYVSSNNGTDFSPIAGPSGFANIYMNGSLGLTGTSSGAIYRSTDNGQTWNQSGSSSAVYDFAQGGGKTFAATGDGIWYSTDQGSSWSNYTSSPSGYSLTVTPNGSYVLAGDDYGIQQCSVNGYTWSYINGGPAGVVTFAVMSSGAIFAGTANGIYKSTNNGGTWGTANNGLASLKVYKLAVSGTKVFAATDAGVSVSFDSGASWVSANSGLPGSSLMNFIAVNNGYVYTANSLTAGAVYRSLLP
jgi:uncharacterized repeat protein (TIGR02543 family)